MKILKYLLFAVIGIVALVLIVALFVDGNYAVEREITVNKPKQEVFDYVKYLKNQDNFSVWAQMDPDMKKDFKGTDGQVGAISSWESERDDVGKGEQEIIKIEEGKRVDYELRFIEPFEAKDNAYMATEALDSTKTKVKWGFNGKMQYPMNTMLLFMDMEQMLGSQLDSGLINLKAVLEK